MSNYLYFVEIVHSPRSWGDVNFGQGDVVGHIFYFISVHLPGIKEQNLLL